MTRSPWHGAFLQEEYSAGNRERLAGLIRRRNGFLSEGVAEDAVDTVHELTEEYIR